jgi:hypothetical protein
VADWLIHHFDAIDAPDSAKSKGAAVSVESTDGGGHMVADTPSGPVT